MNKKRIELILIVLLVILIIANIYVFTLDNDKTESTDNKEYIQFNKIDVSKCSHKTCNEKFKYNDNTISIVSDEKLNYIFSVNNKFVFSFQEYPYIDSTIYTFDDIVLLILKDENFLDYYIYNPKEKKNINLDLIDDNSWKIKSISVDKNKITIEMSRFDDDVQLIDAGKHLISNINTCEEYKKHEQEEVYKKYEILYENGNFKNSKEDKVLLKDYKSYKSLCK